MKGLFLVSTLIVPSLAVLLIPKSEYITHTLFKDSETGDQCDDCCDKKVPLDFPVQFFGKEYEAFWPCANGLISFNGEVRDFTPEPFPIANQPMVAAFWGDADLRTCRPELNVRCSYWKVYYGNEAGLLDDEITRTYFNFPQTFSAKVAIVQTWDGVGYYDKKWDKRNTFQIVVVSDGIKKGNTFAAFYYGRMMWTTGDSSNGIHGLGGTPAQMGFDAGDRKNKYSDPRSRKGEILGLQDNKYIFPISDTVICAAGEQLNDSGECIKLSCSITKDDSGAYKFPIKDARNQPEKLDNGLPNPEHKKVTNVKPGECSNYLTEDYFKKKVASGTSCAMKCVYEESKSLFYQPENQGTPEKTKAGVSAKCDSARWFETGAKNCVEVGIEVSVVDKDNLEVRESLETNKQKIQVKLKSKPFTDGNVILELQTSCIGGKQLQKRKQGDDDFYFCTDGANPSDETKPLASFKVGNKNLYVTTLPFSKTNWDTYKTLEIEGTDNTNKAANGVEEFKIRVYVSAADGEDCEAIAGTSCGIKTPYASFKQVSEIKGKLIDNEGLELKYGDAKRVTSEDGGETTFTLNPKSSTGDTYENKKLTCSSDTEAEAKVTAYKIGAGAKTKIGNAEAVTLTKEVITLFVTGQPDNVVDGPKKFKVSCELAGGGAFILPLSFTNNDVNVPAILVNTSLANNFKAEGECEKDEKMVGGCGFLEFREKSGEDTFTVKLATKPFKNVVVGVNPSDRSMIKAEPEFAIFTPENYDKAVTFTVSGGGDDFKFVDEGFTMESVDILVDTQLTKDIGETKFQGGKSIEIYGYVNCIGSSEQVKPVKAKSGQETTTTASTTTTTTTTTSRELTEDDIELLNLERIETPIKCFSFDVDKVTGIKAKEPDSSLITLNVKINDDSFDTETAVIIGAAAVAGIVAVIIIVLIACAIAAALLAMAIKKKRTEELEHKAKMKTEADKAEGDIEFRMDDLDQEAGMDDIEGTTSKLKGERDRLKDENEKLAAEVGEDAMTVANTEDADLLVEQIKSLKGENDRLREMSQSRNNKRKKKKKKAEGFGQQQD